MKHPASGWLRYLLSVTLAVAAALSASSGVLAYTVVTRDGHRIDVRAKPEIRGLQAYMRLLLGGQLAVIQEDQIDWPRTQAANPAATPISVPSSTKMAQVPAGASKPIEFKLVGSPASKEPAGSETSAQAPQQAKGAVGEQPSEQKRINAQEAVIKLQKEYAQVASVREHEAANKKTWEDELAQLQTKEVGYASETSSTQQRIRELQQLVSDAGSRIGQLETRLNDIRSEVVQLGGSID